MIFGLALLAALSATAVPFGAVQAKDVDICDLASSPATYAGQIVRVRAVASANLDNIPWLIGDCGGQLNAIVLGSDLVNGAQQPLYDYRVPEKVMQAGAFAIMVTMTGQIKQEAVRNGFQVHDTGFHLLPMSVTKVQAVRVELPPVDASYVKAMREDMLKRLNDLVAQHPELEPSIRQLSDQSATPHPPPPPSLPLPAGSAPPP